MRLSAQFAAGAMALVTGIGVLQGALAQDYPVRPLRLVVMFTPGSSADQHGRHIAARLSEQLGQSVIVENKAGAGGLIGIKDVLRAQPLGYSLLLSNPALIGNSLVYKDAGYTPDEFAPIGVMGQTYYGLMINTSVPARNVAELVAYARANPGKLAYSGLGAGAGSTLSAERFKQAAGLDILGVPFKGGDPASAALLANQVQLYFATLSTVKVRMKNPQIRVLGVTATQRSAVMPDVPTFPELGYPTVLGTIWNAVFVPMVTPAPMVRRLREAWTRASATSQMKAMVENSGYEPYGGTLEQFVAGLREETVRLAQDYKRMNVPMLE